VLTLRAAAELLHAADSPPALRALLAPLGISGVLQPLDASHRAALGVIDFPHSWHIVAGPGNVRALVGVARKGPTLRELLPRLAARLQSHAPHVLWIVAAADVRDRSVALAAWSADRRRPRVRALVVHREHLVDSDAETVGALAAASCRDELLLHLRWTEILGRDALNRRFYRELERCVSSLADSATARATPGDRRALALLHTSRLLFLAFLEAKGWLDGRRQFLSESFDQRMARGGGFHARTLRALFFGTLNTPAHRRAPAARAFGRVPFLNGGLFSPTALERRHRALTFTDDAFGALLAGPFAHFRFTAREDAATWSDAAVDPEMLGRAFESLMEQGERHDSGAFFTPQSLVERVTDLALERWLHRAGATPRDAERLLTDGVAPSGRHAALLPHLTRLTLLDPACGSGAFLVHALQRVAGLRAVIGDRRPVSDVRRDVLTRSIFGVDRNPMAVWLCELRLWLSVVIECSPADPMTVAPLPNLDRNVRVGDALSGPAFDGGASDGARTLALLRRRYARATGARKATLGRALDRAERQRALMLLDGHIVGVQHRRRERLLAGRGRDLFGERHGTSAGERDALTALRARAAVLRRERRRVADGGALPFSFAVHVAEVGQSGGFDIVLGNPPWVRLHHIPAHERAVLRRAFAVFQRASWEAGALAARAGAGFAGQVDLSALFVERSAALLRPGGSLALLVPAKLWRALAGGGVRRLVLDTLRLSYLEDLSDAPGAFDAAVYPSIVVASAPVGDQDPPHDATLAVRRGPTLVRWTQHPAAATLDGTPGSPWLLLPPPVRRAFDALAAAGVVLLETPCGRPLLGVKCGCNDAFVVDVLDRRSGVACVRARGGKTGEVETALLRPVLRGEMLEPWRVRPGAQAIIWPHDAAGLPLRELPPRAARWFAGYRRRLVQRSDARRTRAWWSLFRTEGAAHEWPRVVWADFGRRPRAVVLPAGHDAVPLNTCYVSRCAELDDARALAAILNSSLAAAWLGALAEPARGGFKRYLAWSMARLPLPRDWAHARRTLAPLVAESDGRPDTEGVPQRTLDRAVHAAYGLKPATLEPLLTWSTT
jgi:Eco57I restriction-modification methylase